MFNTRQADQLADPGGWPHEHDRLFLVEPDVWKAAGPTEDAATTATAGRYHGPIAAPACAGAGTGTGAP